MALIVVAELVSTVIDEASGWLGERIGMLTLRGVTLGRYPRRPVSDTGRLAASVVGVVVLVFLAVVILYVVASF